MNFRIIIFILIIVGFAACRKDKPYPSLIDNKNCESFDIVLPPQTYFTNGRYQYKAPCFNPNNSNEFIFHYRDNEIHKFQLFKYNIQTKQKILIAESGKIYGQPKWSKKGWIAYTHTSGYVDHIYVVKENGDSLTQFTDNVANHSPAWDSSGDKLYWSYSPVLGIPYYFLSQNLNAPIPDTLSRSGDIYNGFLRHNTISSDNELLSLVHINNSDSPYLAIASLNKNSLVFSNIINTNKVISYLTISGLCWSNNGEYIYATVPSSGYSNGLYKIGVYNPSIELLMSFCDTKSYTSISASPDGKYIVGERIEREAHSNGEIVENSFIYLIDLHTLEEIKIDFE
ncbi:MAG: hypothetical protein H3C31_11030 [Brumimicrobium sp.]|nr:hypothetical protein [Brumimicrobium sp.]